MSKDAAKALENALSQVNEERRGFLKKLLIGSAAVAVLPLMTSSLVAQDGGQGKGDDGKGDGGDGKGKGKGKGGKGKGKGGDGGDGKGKGDGGA
jgi:hypothetical protein